MIRLLCRHCTKGLFALWLFLWMTEPALATSASGSMPFNSSMTQFTTSFEGWIFGASVILWIATCLVLAFGEWGDGFKRIVQIIFWLSLALGGSTGVAYLSTTGAVI